MFPNRTHARTLAYSANGNHQRNITEFLNWLKMGNVLEFMSTNDIFGGDTLPACVNVRRK